MDCPMCGQFTHVKKWPVRFKKFGEYYIDTAKVVGVKDENGVTVFLEGGHSLTLSSESAIDSFSIWLHSETEIEE